MYGAVKGLVAELDDPYAKAFPPAEWERYRRESKGEHTGVGLDLVAIADALVVAAVLPGSPAAAARLRAGERVTHLGGRALVLPGGRELVERALRGPVGGRVALTVAGRDLGGAREVVLERAAYEAPSVFARLVGAGLKVGYVRIAAFRPGTADALKSAAADLLRRGAGGLVLDVRGNRGGAFDGAVAAADLWLASGVVGRTRGRSGGETYRATPDAPAAGVATIALVDGGTASAAELFAGALQDAHAAVLVGEPTYGKGVVQEIIPFASWGGGMKITVARYYTPADHRVEGADAPAGGRPPGGLRPDVSVPVAEAERGRLRRELDRAAWDDRVRAEVVRSEAEAGVAPAVDRAFDVALRLLQGEACDALPIR